MPDTHATPETTPATDDFFDLVDPPAAVPAAERRTRRLAAVGVTALVLALGAGVGAGLMAPWPSAAPVAEGVAVLPPVVERAAAALPPAPAVREAAVAPAPRAVAPVSLSAPVPDAAGIVRMTAAICDVAVEAAPIAAATVELSIRAACDPGARLEVSHDGIAITAALDAGGRAVLEMPALSEAPRYAVAVDGHDPVEVRHAPLDLPGYARAMLVMDAAAGLELHAFERGAAWGERGHVGPLSPGIRPHALSGRGGFLQELGTAATGGRMAMIYTAPADLPVELSVDAVVTEANCGRDIEATAIRAVPGAAPRATPIRVAMPGCDAVGEVVMLGALPG
ncbi:hypothetical protein [Jannaschia sp. W003]|uniref:hypothetical protein n=1 Tax=Jannaschia sp. W003 TaxID=2867012 RepID=UPI0021A5DDA6|nr:hypothetical protein [Jannaschia sp. W003]UWQ21909.1 hypothetical protein K3554_02445 [Jannaschia sp. W003]